MPSWLNNVLGPRPAGRVVSVRSRGTPYPTAPAGGNGGGGGGGVDINAIMERLQGQWDAANAAGESQYQNLLGSVSNTRGEVGGIFDRAESMLEGQGTAARTRIESNRVKNLGTTENDLINRGLGNTTVRTSARRGVNVDAERAEQAVDEQVSGQRAGLLTQRAGAAAGIGNLEADAILSRRNQGPDPSIYANLLAQYGQSGGGGGPTSWQPHMGPSPGIYWSDYYGPRPT